MDSFGPSIQIRTAKWYGFLKLALEESMAAINGVRPLTAKPFTPKSPIPIINWPNSLPAFLQVKLPMEGIGRHSMPPPEKSFGKLQCQQEHTPYGVRV